MGLKGKGRSMNSDGDAELCSLLPLAPKAQFGLEMEME